MRRDPVDFRSALDDLPVFASDLDIAKAIVGKAHAAEWLKARLPTLEHRLGFPRVDPFHGGRPVPLVRTFYEEYFRLTGSPPDGKEGEWKRRRSKPKAD